MTSNRSETRVLVDGRDVGVTPLSIAAVEGEHDVVVTSRGATRRTVVRIAHDGLESFSAQFGEARLAIRGVPVGVVCSLDGADLGRPEWEGRWLVVAEGKHELVCDDPAGQPHIEHLNVEPDRRYTFTWPR